MLQIKDGLPRRGLLPPAMPNVSMTVRGGSYVFRPQAVIRLWKLRFADRTR
jgi:hypothetical protein